MNEKTTHPDQPLIVAVDGVLRFKKNEIVEHLLHCHSVDLSDLMANYEFTNEDWAQFMQLLGISYDFYVNRNLPSKIKDRIDPDDIKVDNDDPVLRARYGLRGTD